MAEQPPKFNIEKDAQELKIFMFTIQSGPIKIDLPEDFKAIMAYNDGDAMNQVLKEYPPGLQLFIRKKAQVEVRKIVDAVNLLPTTPQNVQLTVAPPESKEKTAQQFVRGLMLVADKFVTNARDRASLKRILGKIKLTEDPVDTTVKN